MAMSKRTQPARPMCILFFREDCFYPTEYPAGYSDWQAEADRNPGTIRIEDLKGNVLWKAPVLQ